MYQHTQHFTIAYFMVLFSGSFVAYHCDIAPYISRSFSGS